MVPPDHKWARRSVPVSPTELNETRAGVTGNRFGHKEALSSALRSALGPSSRQSDPAIELSSAAAMRAAVLAGAGPAVMSRLAVDDDLTLGRLREVPIAGLDLRRELRAIWSGGRTRLPGRCATCSATSLHINTAESDARVVSTTEVRPLRRARRTRQASAAQ